MDQRRAILKEAGLPGVRRETHHQDWRRDIVALLDEIEDTRGAPMADLTLMVIRRV